MKKGTFKQVCIFIIAVGLFAFPGCAGYIDYMKGSTTPSFNGTQTITRYESKAYDVLGIVRAEGNSKCIMGIIVEGTEGTGLLWDAARNQFGDRVTGIKDINLSYDYQSVLSPIFCEITTIYVGTAVHEK